MFRRNITTKVGYQYLSRSLHSSKVSLPDKNATIDKFDFRHFTHTIGNINDRYTTLIDQSVTLNGWIDGFPRKISKNLVFAKFRDFNGEFTQIVTKSEEWSKILRTLKPEDALSVTGKVNIKKQKKDDIIQSWELSVENFQILNDSNEKVTQLDSLKETPNQYPPEYRYLQLRSPYYQRALKLRAHAARVARSVLDSMNFTEIETPLLFKSTPEGAKEFLVPTRRPGFFYALPQSPQQYKQLLMASGFKGYYQIAKCFRDEDLRADRQPEFTQIDMEMSFAKSGDIQKVVESLVSNIWKKVKGLPLYRVEWTTGNLVELKENESFPKLDYQTALSKFGIDKPDLRSNLTFEDLSEFFVSPLKDEKFPIIEACVLKGALSLKDVNGKPKKLPKQLFDKLEYKDRTPFIFKIKNQEDLYNWINKFPIKLNDKESISKLNSTLGLEINDIVAIADRATLTYENPTPLGRFRQLAIQNFPSEWRREIETDTTPQSLDDIFVASWLVDFPLFSPKELETSEGYPIYNFEQFESTHHPFTMAKLEDYDYLATDPLRVKGDHYDLVINGVEVGGGSRRVHDAQLQKYIFSEILQIKNHMNLFGHLIHALDSGCPPHSGLAIGFDRMCSMLLGSSNIRDVVAFPKTQTGSDPVVESPSVVPTKTLDLYSISLKGEKS